MPAAHASDSERFSQMEQSLRENFEAIAALTAISQPALFAVFFGVDMCFRLLKLGNRIRQVCAEQGKDFREKVSMQGFLLPPAYVRPITTLVESFFMSLPPDSDIYQEMEDQIEQYKNGGFSARRKAMRKLTVAYWLLNEGSNWKENPDLLTLVNAEIRPEGELSFRQMVDAMEPLYNKDAIGIDDFENLQNEYVLQDLAALQLNTQRLTAELRHNLSAAVRQMYWHTLVEEDDSVLKNTLRFLMLKKLDAKRKQLEAMQENAAAMTMTAENREDLSAESEKLQQEITRLETLTQN